MLGQVFPQVGPGELMTWIVSPSQTSLKPSSAAVSLIISTPDFTFINKIQYLVFLILMSLSISSWAF